MMFAPIAQAPRCKRMLQNCLRRNPRHGTCRADWTKRLRRGMGERPPWLCAGVSAGRGWVNSDRIPWIARPLWLGFLPTHERVSRCQNSETA